MYDSAIPMVSLKLELPDNAQRYTESILVDEIKGIHIEYVAINSDLPAIDFSKDGYKTIYMFVKGKGVAMAADKNFAIVPETILLPNIAKKITIQAAAYDTLHYLKIATKLTAEDRLDLEGFPPENTQHVYYAKFADCSSYSEPIKSPNTISRTILPNKYIPRIAMGTVQTTGPDEVGAHQHPMLEQLFLGLSKNNCTVYADDDKTNFPEYAILHIPLGSLHSVSVEKNETMYYVWMDFFLNKKGEEWLKTHIDD